MVVEVNLEVAPKVPLSYLLFDRQSMLVMAGEPDAVAVST
jgi:hypothetical protein